MILDETESPSILASRKRRLLAFGLDYFIFILVILTASLLAMGDRFIDRPQYERFAFVFPVMAVIVILLFFLKDSIHGISFGKWAMGIMVGDDSDHAKTPGIGRMLARNLFLIIWPVEFIVMVVSPQKKRIGDRVTKSVVLMNPQKSGSLPRVAVTGLFFAAGFTLIFFYTINAIKKSDPYEAAVESIKANPEIKTEIGSIKSFGNYPTGNLNLSSGYGKADLHVNISGERKDITVNIFLEKKPDEDWIVTKTEW